jgi:response regulator RpfG family c-di-GMP phosphodiesterase
MQNISELIDNQLKEVSKKELKLEKNVKFIKETLKDMKTSLIQSILDKNIEKQEMRYLERSIKSVRNKLREIELNSYFQTDERKKILKRLRARINGYYDILKEMPEDFKESFEDGTYSIISLSYIEKKLNTDLIKLQNITKEILTSKIYGIVESRVKSNMMILVTSLFLLFLFTKYIIDNQIMASLLKLKDLNHSFLQFVKHKVSKVEKIDKSKIPNDEIGDIIKDIADNINYVEEILKEELNQREIIFTMGMMGEKRSKETGNHVKRVAEYSYLLAKLYGLSEEEAQLIKEASPLHDLGKVAIPDSILNKPGKLTPEEFEIMKNHAQFGYDILKSSNTPIIKAAAIIAHQHHEKYNGKGYPQGLKGDEIHIYGAIVAIADVFDALGSNRVYKKAWDDERIINLFIEETGEHFHPVLANLFLANFEKFTAIRDRFKDEFIQEDEKVLVA